MTISDERVLARIEGLSCDSRKVRHGWLFAALQGEREKGADYIEQALESGASAVLVERDRKKPLRLAHDVLWLECSEPRKRYAELAAAWWQKVPDTLVGVTGTNGKTSSVFFLQQLWHAAGAQSASLGTLGVGRGGEAAQTANATEGLTTAEPMALHALLADLAQEGVSHCALEASSHGLAQYRLDGLRFKACVLTNLSRDHLDYHKSWEAYRGAKARLFTALREKGGWMILPDADPFAKRLLEEVGKKAKVMRTRVADEDSAEDSADDTLQAFGVVRKEGRTEFSLRLRCKNFCGDREILLEGLKVGFEESFQLHNLLGALAAFFVTERGGAWDMAWLRATLARLRCARGRMERFAHPRFEAHVYVDYAHTPQALEVVLREGRRLAQQLGGRLACVFGCGGERDRGKRFEMGRVAGELADDIVITDDNPRGEDAASIRAAIARSLRDGNVPYQEIGERKLAIEQGIANLTAGDVLIVAGKGHEQGQLAGDSVRPFDDAAVVRETLARIKTAERA